MIKSDKLIRINPCPFCELEKFVDGYAPVRQRIIWENDKFFVCADIHPMGMRGYILLVTKEHYYSVQNAPDDLKFVLDRAKNKIAGILKRVYKKDILIFEHGSCENFTKKPQGQRATCISHAHIHFVPVSVDVMKIIDVVIREHICFEIKSLSELNLKSIDDYIYIEGNKKKIVCSTPKDVPSQMIRRLLHKFERRTSHWNWREVQDLQTALNTVKDLKQFA